MAETIPNPNTPPPAVDVQKKTGEEEQKPIIEASTVAAPEKSAEQKAKEVKAASQDQRAELKGKIGEQIKTFVQAVKQGDGATLSSVMDFEGEHDSPGEVEKNAIFKPLLERLSNFWQTNECSAGENRQKEWRDATATFMLKEIRAYDNASGTMGEKEVNDAFAVLENPEAKGGKNGDQQGIGPFEKWFEKNHKEEFTAWKEGEKVHHEEKQNRIQTLAALEVRANNIPASFRPSKLLAEDLPSLKSAITKEPGEDFTAYDDRLSELTARIAALESLKVLAEDSDIPADKKNPLLAEVKNGTKNPADIQKELEQSKALTVASREKENASEGPYVDQFVDKIKDGLSFIGDFLGDGPMAKSFTNGLHKLGALVVAFFVGAGSKSDSITNFMIAHGIISSERLKNAGNKAAGLIYDIETKFTSAGLPRSLAAAVAGKLGKKSVRQVIETLQKEPEKYTDKTDRQQQLALLAGQLQTKAAGSLDAPLLSFMSANPTLDMGSLRLASSAATTTPTASPTAAAQPAAAKTPPAAGENAPEKTKAAG